MISTNSVSATISAYTEKYSEILDFYGLEYKVAEYYLQVGNIDAPQGWILHISVVISQVTDMLHTIIPVLASKAIPFKIAMNKEVCSNLLNGHFGVPQIGKIVSVYPATDEETASIARLLISKSGAFKGPNVPTDFHLGTVVFARYGSWNPVVQKNARGNQAKFIYNPKGELIEDAYHVPFRFPDGISWPFHEIAAPILPTYKKLLNNLYKPESVLKADVKGIVFKGRYMKSLFKPAFCVIKQGIKHMVSDDAGRDIHDRLAWQYQVHKELADTIRIPKIIDFFDQEQHTYLVMEFINGSSLYDTIKDLNAHNQCWRQLEKRVQLNVIDYLLELAEIVHKLHEKGFVHRDIQPTNFIVNGNELVLIDIELAWSSRDKQPNPPFDLGTPGFMSPEQQAIQTPTFKEDIYGLGAVMINLFTGLSPTKFNSEKPENLYFFIGNKAIVELIISCLHPVPEQRPELKLIRASLLKYKSDLTANAIDTPLKISTDNILKAAFKGLNSPPIVMSEGYWYSQDRRTENVGTSHQKEYTRLPGLYEGTGGILYLLSRAKKIGYDIKSCMTEYLKGWEYIREFTIKNQANLPSGLYMGAAGMAVTLKEAIEAGLIEEDLPLLEQYIDNPVIGLDVATGIAGHGIAILQCNKYINRDDLLQNGNDILLFHQGKDGAWMLPADSEGKIHTKNIGFTNGNSGIVWYLLEFLSRCQDSKVEKAAVKALTWLSKQTNQLTDIFNRVSFKELTNTTNTTGDERTGLLLTFIKAYETLRDANYRKIAEVALAKYAPYVVIDNLTQENGLAGLGEVYLEAARVFNNEEWRERAGWIEQLLANTAFMDKGGWCYWQMQENNLPTADLMTGNSGVIHFLLRYRSEELGYRMLK